MNKARRGGMSARFAKQRARAALAELEDPIADPSPVSPSLATSASVLLTTLTALILSPLRRPLSPGRRLMTRTSCRPTTG